MTSVRNFGSAAFATAIISSTFAGFSASARHMSVTIENPGLTSYVVEQLTPATWYFVATALNAQGIESGESNVAQKQVL